MLEKIEKKFGRYAIKNLIYYVLGAYVIGYVLALTNERLGWYEYITLSPELVMKGQVWRLFTWVCTIPQSLSIFVIFMFLFYFFIGKSLEKHMGAFRYNLFIFSGWFLTTLGAMAFYWLTTAIYGSGMGISVEASTYFLNLTSFLAYALLFPDAIVYFFGILPIKMKILAWIDVGYLGLQIISCIISMISLPNELVQTYLVNFGFSISYVRLTIISEIVTIVMSLLNFIIFFICSRKKRAENAKRKKEFQQSYNSGIDQNKQRFSASGAYYGTGASAQDLNRQEAAKSNLRPDSSAVLVHKCSICGRNSLDNPELTFRFCSKCEGEFEYCQDHLFTHVHVKE